MRKYFQCLLLFAVTFLNFIVESRDCGSASTSLCEVRYPRDVIFLVDGSDSMDPAHFYGEMLDYVQSLWCTLNTQDRNRGAIITFNQKVQVRVPFQEYTPDEWFGAVELIRTDPTSCCSCCTPLAEAFALATKIFTENPSIEFNNQKIVRIVFVITDGAPWQNKAVLPGYYSWPKYKAGVYRYTIVPQQALNLKNLLGEDSVRLLLVGVPDKWGDAPEIEYFSGYSTPAKSKQCVSRAQQNDCVTIKAGLFPIISSPPDKNLFLSPGWSVDTLLSDTVNDLCQVIYTGIPTVLPTKSPTGTPTVLPTRSPSRTPSKAPRTSKPSAQPSSAPTHLPSKAPTFSKPTHTPTRSPTARRKFDGLDLYIFLDRSKSIRWRAKSCRAAPGANQQVDDAHVCWTLFLGFVKNLSLKLAALKFKEYAALGWQDENTDKTKGLRVWVMGFACSEKQKSPIVVEIGKKISNATQLLSALEVAEALTPDGGTCPGSAIERSVGFIMANDLVSRPFKAALLFTDGVFYDAPIPQNAAKGLFYFGALTYAFGISVPNNGNNFGLTPKEIQDQKAQLLAFANNDPTRVLNFGLNGYSILDQIAESFATRLPLDWESSVQVLYEHPYWCGFSSNERCLNTNPATFDTSKYCKWIPKDPQKFEGAGECLDKTDCSLTKAKCQYDSANCVWSGGKCINKPKLVG